MIEVTVSNRLVMRLDELSPEMDEWLREKFTHKNPAHSKMKHFGHKYTSEPEFIETWRVDSQGSDSEMLSLPRGGMQKFREACDVFDVDYSVIDNRSKGDQFRFGSYVDGWQIGTDLFPLHNVVPWDHQQMIVETGLKYGQALIRSPTGSGKTTGVLRLIAATQVPSLVIVWDTALLKQWQERILKELGIPVSKQGLIRGSTFRLAPITLAMQQTLTRWEDKKWDRFFVGGRGIFGGVYCDEVQRYAASTYTGQIDRFDAFYRIGVTADERRKDGKTFIIYDMFGPVRYEVKKKDLVKKRIIHDVECYVVPTNFTAEWFAKKRENGEQDLSDNRRLLEEMMNDDERNELAVSLIEECVQAGLPTLAFAQYVEHAHKINEALVDNGVASGLALGGTEWEQTFQETIDGLRNGQLQVGCGTFGKLGVGHDIPTVAAGVAMTHVHNNRSFLGQVKGRICRTTEGKQNARIIIMWDRMVFGDTPLYNLKKWNDVCRVWCEWTKQWMDVSDYLKEKRHVAQIKSAPSSTATLFKSAQDRDLGPGRRH